MAVRTFATSRLGLEPERIGPTEAPALLEALRPMLNTLVGVERAGSLVASLRRELEER